MHAAGALGYRSRKAAPNLTSEHSTFGSFDGSTGFANAAPTASGKASAVTSNAHFLLFNLNPPRCWNTPVVSVTGRIQMSKNRNLRHVIYTAVAVERTVRKRRTCRGPGRQSRRHINDCV